MRISSFFCFSKPAVSGDDASPASTTSRRSTRGQPIGDIPVPRTEPAAALNVTESAAPQRPSERPRRTGALTRLKQIRDSLRDSAFQHGVGVSQSTVSPAFNPFNTRTSSAQPKLGSFVYQDGAAAPVVPKSLRDAPGTAERAQPGKGPALNALQQDAGIHRTIGKHFRGSDAERRALESNVTEFKAARGLSTGEAIVLTKALALRMGGGIAQAQRVLEALPRVRLAADIVSPRSLPEGEQGEALRMAWKFAAGIEGLKGGKGLDILAKATGRSDGVQGPAFGTAEQGALRAYLRAASEVARAAAAAGVDAPGFDPASMYAHGKVGEAIRRAGGDWPGRAGTATPSGVSLTLAEKALLAVRDELDPAVDAIHGCRFAVQMLRGGMPTDAPRNPDGTKSEFQQVESRASKTLGAHLNRAVASPTGFQAMADTLRYAALHKGKSPFYAYDALVSARGRNMGFALSHIGGIQEGRAVKDMIEVIESALHGRGGMGGGALPSTRAPVAASDVLADAGAQGTLVRNMARSAILHLAKSEALLLPRLARGDRLSEAAIAKAREAVLATIDLPGGALPEALARHLDDALAQENMRLTPDRLLAWAADAGGPADAAAAEELRTYPAAADTPDWKGFSTAFARASRGEVSLPPNLPLKGRTRAEAAEILASMVRGEELGSGFSLTNAGSTQGTTRNVTQVLSRLASAGAVGLRADLGGGLTRIVGFESGGAADRSSLRMTVSTVRRVQGGVGAALGPKIGQEGTASFSAFVGADVGHSYELVHQEGAVFGFPMHLAGGIAGGRDLAARKARLVKLLIGVPDAGGAYCQPGNEEDRSSLVKRAYQEFGDQISVGRFEMKQKDHRLTGGPAVGAGATVGQLRVGLPQVGLTSEARFGTLEYADLSGTLTLERTSRSQGFRATVAGGLTSLSGLHQVVHPSANPVGMAERMDVAGIGTASADVVRDGETRTDCRIFHDGRELPSSFTMRIFQNSDGAVKELAPDFENYAIDKATKFFPGRLAGDRDAAVRIEKQMMGEHIGRAREHRDMTAATWLYREWNADHIADANLLEADGELSQALGDKRGAELARREIAAIHEAQEYQEGRFVVTAYEQSMGDTRGINGLMGLRHDVRTTASVRSLNFT
ncbi:hypothetical protein C8E08_0783 [Paracidovorax citrulli]|uniref:Uncharacterized protein n=1 Tax=Paracidovorax citrulli (strain AAC00-1) TaxID=397945 RepID=A1TSX0_PARC0|nr:hypothetical protein Aave_3503 [Paracidovorax citrulli AAC00-1]ATG93578.1 hypothetical protein CQB05_05615 [Paracidovorax citrulli]PVY63497.1 hypothetical protein C8E08_0783 [Paracidovorax citrulli]REG67536.1 hypothetical protein C8E07_0604 [Paracidovorax citrulli]RLJ92096.1 hypothetical protein C8E06_0605 [Paracidovorax citrulli]